jgi:hypothetical protein
MLLVGIICIVGSVVVFLAAPSTGATVQWLRGIGLVTGLSLIAWHYYDAHHAFLDRLTFALAVAAIVFASFQFDDSRNQEKTMNRLASEMSTHFAGFFPKNMKDINDILLRVDKRVDIMADFVGYGHYSAPEQFDIYFRQLEDLKSDQNKRIRILVYTSATAGKVQDNQFSSKWFANANKDPLLKRFCARHNGGQMPKDRQGFDTLMFREQRRYIEDLKNRGIDIRVTDSELPFFLWDEDDQEAVFSFIHDFNEDWETLEVSFRTRDTSLIVDTFKVKFCKLWNEAREVELTPDGWVAARTPSKPDKNCAAH